MQGRGFFWDAACKRRKFFACNYFWLEKHCFSLCTLCSFMHNLHSTLFERHGSPARRLVRCTMNPSLWNTCSVALFR